MPLASRRLGLVFGGASGEHAVSILSAITVLKALQSGANAQRYQVDCFYIDEHGRWWPPAVAEAVLSKGLPATDAELPATPVRAGFHGLPEGARGVDVWFPVLHGPNGEDGTIQGLFTLMRAPFVGSGVLGSAVGMDKQAMKAAFAAAGLPQVPYAAVMAAELDPDPDPLLDRLEAQLGYPCFVKPANLGSSVGISKATDRPSLLAGLQQAASFDPRLVVERGVKARELECAVRSLGNRPGGPLEASVVGEIRFEADWYDYAAKYTEGLSSTEIPARLPEPVSAELRRLAILATRAVAATGLARVDFFYEPASGSIWLNEINTLPGFTNQSMYPMLWQASGVSLEDLVHGLVLAAGENGGTMVGEMLAP